MNQFLNLEIQSMEQDHEKLISGLESILLDTFSIIKDKNDMLAAKEAGLLSDASLKLFADKVNTYLAKVSPDNMVNVAGLESDFGENKEAGLESVIESIKRGLAAFIAFFAQIINNVETFFKNVFTKIMFRTKVLDVKLKELEERINKIDSDTLAIKYEQFEKIIAKNLAIFTYSTIATKDPEKFFKMIPEIMEFYAESKLPIVKKIDIEDIEFDFIPVSKFEKEIIIGVMILLNENPFPNFSLSQIKSELGKSLGMRIINISGNAINVLIYNKKGLVDYKEVPFTIKVELPKEDRVVLNVDAKVVKSAIAAISDAIKNFPKLREENNKRIKDFKKNTDGIIKIIEREIKESTEMTSSRSYELLRMSGVIWRVYPDVSNRSIRALHTHIEEYTGYIDRIVSGKNTGDDKTETVETEIVD